MMDKYIETIQFKGLSKKASLIMIFSGLGLAIISLCINMIIAVDVCGYVGWMFKGIEYGYYWGFIGAFLGLALMAVGLYFFFHRDYEEKIEIDNSILKITLTEKYTISVHEILLSKTNEFSLVNNSKNSFLTISTNSEKFKFLFSIKAFEFLEKQFKK